MTLSAEDLVGAVTEASRRIRQHVRETPVEFSGSLSELLGARVHLKLENTQLTGSFKVRGALNKLLSLAPDERARGVVAASSGNHGAGVACAAGIAGCRALVFVPDHAPAHKVAAITALGAEVQRHGHDCVLTEQHARAFADAEGMTYVSPYNDPAVIAGQGTIAAELERQVNPMDAVFVALGGGGLISGIGGYLRGKAHGAQVIACSPANSPVMHESVRAGEIVEMESLPTLSDSTAGGVEAGAITFPLCEELIDDSVLVTEQEIASALRLVIERHHTLIEGAAAVAVAGLTKVAERYHGKDVVVVLCGANIGADTLGEVLTTELP